MTFQTHGPLLFISTTLFAWTHTFTSIVASSPRNRNHRFHDVALQLPSIHTAMLCGFSLLTALFKLRFLSFIVLGERI
jgi:hypothetical protein